VIVLEVELCRHPLGELARPRVDLTEGLHMIRPER
jgi:hypothetical protein